MEERFCIRLREARRYRRLMRTRFPFRFGKASVTEAPIVYVRLYLESEDGKIVEGVSASGICPLWFDKRPGRAVVDKEADLLRSLSEAIEAYSAGGFGSAWDLHHATAAAVSRRLTDQGMTALAAGFGPAIVDAGICDSVCRFLRQPFSAALRHGLGLPARDAALLPEKPLELVHLRHTIGLADALCADDLKNPLRDGLPETLEEVIETYRPVFFKIKISGDPTETIPRLHRIAEIFDARLADYAVTLDGNEQFSDMVTFRLFLEQLRSERGMSAFVSRILWIEQPVMREWALDPTSASDLAAVARFKPVIIDESDDEPTALNRALALGYSGVSSKLCKGVFRSIAHYLRLRQARAEGQRGLIISSEDLTTVPVHPLQQDLCLAAALGLTHSERNGHHYIRSFEFMTAAERENALSRYSSLYEADGNGTARVRIVNGGFNLADVNSALSFGADSFPEWSALQPLE